MARRCIGLGCAGIPVDEGCNICRADVGDCVEDQAPCKVSENFLQQTPASAVMNAWKDARAFADTHAADESEPTLAAREGDRSPDLAAGTAGVVRARTSELCIALDGWESRDGKGLRRSGRPELGPDRTLRVPLGTALDTEACSNPHVAVLRGTTLSLWLSSQSVLRKRGRGKWAR